MKCRTLKRSLPAAAVVLATLLSAFDASAQDADPAPRTEDTGSETTESATPSGEAAGLPPILVEGDQSAQPPHEPSPLATETVRPTAASTSRGADAGAMLQGVPGAAVIRNGAQTGIVQLRGLGGDRVKVTLDGATVTPACPNHMDPPLHYAAPSDVESMTVMAGITPVSLGGDSIGGSVLVDSAAPVFAADGATRWSARAGSHYRGSNEGYGVHGGVGAATDDISLRYHGTREEGDDLRYPGGRVRASGYETQQHTVRSDYRSGGGSGLWGAEVAVLSTRDAGTPALPMDMIEDDGLRMAFDGDLTLGFGTLRGLVYHNTIDHLMDNYSMRPLAPGAMQMFSDAASDDTGAGVDATLPHGRSTFRVGTGFHLNRMDVYQQNAMTGMQQDTFRNAWRARIGTYGEWQTDWSSRWKSVVGVRNDTVLSDAADIRRFNPMGTAPADAAAFNARGHDFVDPNFDVTATLRLTTTRAGAWELGFARKNRSPSLLERYLWTPLAANAGQADGRTYIGNLDLDPETSHLLSLTADWQGSRWRLRTTPYYNFVSDYIQGVPVPYGMGTVLQYQNLDRADLYGIDVSGALDLGAHFTLDGWMSYVRGRDRDRDDNLYRIAPLRGLFALGHRPGNWQNAVEVVWAARQDKTAAYNDELPTSGWA
ncbi:MAG: TonB-dependent receptor plug domain-containing protein, partial [Candidatus Binatia bacterium]